MIKPNQIIDIITNIQAEIPLVAITGMCKNAGKTTFLNWLTLNLATQGDLALLTTGRDGEDFDLVGGHDKPKVFIPQNSIFVTHSNILERFSGKVEILHKSNYKAGPFNIWVVRALQELHTEIIGPSTASEQIKLASLIKTYSPKYILIDGSLDRKAITLQPEVDAIVLVVSANCGTLEEILNELKRLIKLTAIPLLSPEIKIQASDNLRLLKDGKIAMERATLLGYEKDVLTFLQENKVDYIYFSGVLTDTIWDKVKHGFQKHAKAIIINHPYQIQMSYGTLQQMLAKVQVVTLNKFEIACLALNSFSVKGRHLDAEVMFSSISKITKIPIIDCMEVL